MSTKTEPPAKDDTILSHQAIMMLMNGQQVSSAILQILSTKKVAGANPTERYQALISDGVYSTSDVMLNENINQLITEGKLPDLSVVKVQPAISTVNGRRVIVLLELETLVANCDQKIGHAVPWSKDGKSGQQPAASAMNDSQDSESDGGFLTPRKRKARKALTLTQTDKLRYAYKKARGLPDLISDDTMDDIIALGIERRTVLRHFKKIEQQDPQNQIFEAGDIAALACMTCGFIFIRPVVLSCQHVTCEKCIGQSCIICGVPSGECKKAVTVADIVNFSLNFASSEIVGRRLAEEARRHFLQFDRVQDQVEDDEARG